MGRKPWKDQLSTIFDIIGEILAVVYVVVFVLLLIDAQWPFISKVDWLIKTMKVIWMYGGLVIVGIVGLEAMVKRNIIFFILFVALLSLCIIFSFFPGTYEHLLSFVK